MIVSIAWIAAALVALVVLGFTTYEVTWKSKRLASDLHRLQGDIAQLNEVQRDLASAAAQLVEARACRARAWR